MVTLATRESPLALRQTELVANWLRKKHTTDITFFKTTTQGDQNLSTRLDKIGGKGLFIKELEEALQNGSADIAVHSMKDMPMILPDGFTILAVSTREDPRDAFVSTRFSSLSELPNGAVIGTSSLRRQMQLLHRFPHLKIEMLRGNVNTRLKKLDENQFDGVILAAAGLKRLELGHRINEFLSVEESIPAAGQGVLAIECLTKRADEMRALFEGFHDPETEQCVTAERALCRALEGGCHVPIASYAFIQNHTLQLSAAIGSKNGQTLLRVHEQGEPENAENIGKKAAFSLLEQGARSILDEYTHG